MAKLRAVEQKARECEVEYWRYEDLYTVRSPSGKVYEIRVRDEGASGTCNCAWGQVHPDASLENGCSHLRAVWAYLRAPDAKAFEAESDAAYEAALREAEALARDCGEAYEAARAAGYSEADAAAAADSMCGYTPEEYYAE